MALWYLRAYLWFVLLSPILWLAFRRQPVLTLVIPLVVAMVWYSPVFPAPSGLLADGLSTTVLYGTGWMLGFARYTGLIDRVNGWVPLALAASAAIAGILGFSHPLPEALWGTGFTLVLMRWRPDLDWLGRRPA